MAESTKKDKEKASGEEKLSKKETAFLESKARGNDAVSAGQWAAAIEAYTEAIKSGPSTYFELNGPGAAVLSNRSLAYLKCGNFDKALQVKIRKGLPTSTMLVRFSCHTRMFP